MSYKILIAEDDVFISEHLKQILIVQGYEVCAIVSSEEEANAYFLKNSAPDLALLDIQMHGRDQGIEIAKLLNKKNVPFLYITSFSDKETLQNAVKQEPKGYILKPFTEEEVLEMVNSIFKDLSPNYLMAKDKLESVKVMLSEIVYVKSSNVYVEIYTVSKRYVCRQKLTDLEKQLPVDQFLRTQRSYIVNKAHILKVNSESLTTTSGFSIPVSKKYKNIRNQI